MGLFYQKYKQCLEEFNAVKDDKYDSVSMASDPKGYLDYRTKQRWYETRLTSARSAIGFSIFSMGKFRPILEKTLGQDEAGKFIQNTRNRDNFYWWAAKSLMQNYPDAVATLSETDQKAFRSNVKKIKALNIAFQFQKTLAVNFNQELIRNFMADHNNPKKALDNIFSALNQQAEKEIQKTTQKKNQTKELGSAGGDELNVVKMESK